MESDIKKCPFCAEEIKIEAVKCKHCGSVINNNFYQEKTPFPVRKAVIIGSVAIVICLFLFIACGLVASKFFKVDKEKEAKNLQECLHNMEMVQAGIECEMFNKNTSILPENLNSFYETYNKNPIVCPSCGKRYMYRKLSSDTYVISCGGENAHCKTNLTGKGYFPERKVVFSEYPEAFIILGK